MSAILILVLPRRYVILGVLVAGLLIPLDQTLVVSGIHLQMLRLTIFAGWIRITGSKIGSGLTVLSGGWNLIDCAVGFWTFSTLLATLFLWQSFEALVGQLGVVYTVLGLYVLMRFLLRDGKDIEVAIIALVYISLVVATVMAVEQITRHNPYAQLGGAAEAFRIKGMLRDKHFRAMACFAHPILAGTFGAVELPLFVVLRWKGKRWTAMIGILASSVIVAASVSSTSILAYSAGISALLLWRFRHRLRSFRWAVFIALVSLHFMMKAPVWALIERLDVIGGSSGYHRYVIVDQFVRHFREWWLLGAKDTTSWGFFTWDSANQYVAIGEKAGLIPLVCFVTIIVLGFKYLGKARVVAHNSQTEHILWAIGCSLFANVVAFVGIFYFDQIIVVWYLLLATISATAVPVIVAQTDMTSLDDNTGSGEGLVSESVWDAWSHESVHNTERATSF